MLILKKQKIKVQDSYLSWVTADCVGTVLLSSLLAGKSKIKGYFFNTNLILNLFVAKVNLIWGIDPWHFLLSLFYLR